MTVTIADVDDPTNCTLDVTITDPGPCSTDCSLTADGLANVICNDATTTSDATDDFITFDLNPTGLNLGATYNVTVSSGTITPTSGTYGSATTFQLQAGSAGAGDVTVTIADVDDPTNCTLDVTITDPGPCSTDCSLTADGLANVICNDATTTSDATDDFISFELNPTGLNLGATYNVTVSSGTITPTSGTYGSATTFQLQAGSAGAGDVTVTIADVDDPTNCTLDVTITDPGPCSTDCSLTADGLANVICNDATTTSDATDDFITFELNPTGLNLGATYNVTVSSGTITPTSATYGSATSFQLQAGSAGAGNVTVTIADVDDPTNCTLDVTITDPGTCSTDCFINNRWTCQCAL